MRAAIARPREARGWFVYAVGVSVAFLMLALRLYYETGSATSPFLLYSWIDVPFLIGILAGALAAVGLHQALWYFLVKPGGWTLYGASFLMFAVASLFFYALPGHVPGVGPAPPFPVFLPMFVASLVLYLYVPALSYGSRVWTGIAVAGDTAILGLSVYGPLQGFVSFTDPVVVSTLAAEGVLLLALLRLLQLAVQKAGIAAPA